MPTLPHAWGQLVNLLLATIGIGTLLAAIVVVLPFGRTRPPGVRATWPRRSTYTKMTLFFLGVATYGSFVPLNFHWLAWPEVISRIRAVPPLCWDTSSRADWGANVLLFVPVGYCALAALTLERTARLWHLLAFAVVAFISVAASTAIELGQLWLRSRTTSQNDIYAQCLGTLIGGVAWLIVGRELHRWLGTYRSSAAPRSKLHWILALYAIGLFMYSVLPFDLTASLSDLARKIRDGRVALVPFADFHMTSSYLFGVASDVIVFVPVGALAAIWRPSDHGEVRGVGAAMLLTGLFALAIETTQLLIPGRFTSVTDILVAMVGGALGSWLMRRWCRTGPRRDGKISAKMRGGSRHDERLKK